MIFNILLSGSSIRLALMNSWYSSDELKKYSNKCKKLLQNFYRDHYNCFIYVINDWRLLSEHSECCTASLKKLSEYFEIVSERIMTQTHRKIILIPNQSLVKSIAFQVNISSKTWDLWICFIRKFQVFHGSNLMTVL